MRDVALYGIEPRESFRKTPLTPSEEQEFQRWYAEIAAASGLAPDPDDPLHLYDYRGAFKAGAFPSPDASDSMRPHWPSRFKAPTHPNRYVGGLDTLMGRPTTGRPNPLDLLLPSTLDRLFQ